MTIKEIRTLITNYEKAQSKVNTIRNIKYTEGLTMNQIPNNPEFKKAIAEETKIYNKIKDIFDIGCGDYGDEYCLCQNGILKVLDVLENK